MSIMEDNKTKLVTIKVEAASFIIPPGGTIPKTFPTHSEDINGEIIHVGDIVGYDFKEDANCSFEVVFEGNAFRKKYKKWDKTLEKPILECGEFAKKMRLIIVKSTVYDNSER